MVDLWLYPSSIRYDQQEWREAYADEYPSFLYRGTGPISVLTDSLTELDSDTFSYRIGDGRLPVFASEYVVGNGASSQDISEVVTDYNVNGAAKYALWYDGATDELRLRAFARGRDTHDPQTGLPYLKRSLRELGSRRTRMMLEGTLATDVPNEHTARHLLNTEFSALLDEERLPV